MHHRQRAALRKLRSARLLDPFFTAEELAELQMSLDLCDLVAGTHVVPVVGGDLAAVAPTAPWFRDTEQEIMDETRLNTLSQTIAKYRLNVAKCRRGEVEASAGTWGRPFTRLPRRILLVATALLVSGIFWHRTAATCRRPALLLNVSTK
jgi:hypothetical protein